LLIIMNAMIKKGELWRETTAFKI
ncbi:MAG: hypothetical protein K0R24_2392, partial [Gammaproteobacteria bacterium]|nr:hypothetical protein [Gammaproteobacteria bacterium]MCE3239411.1 hypothetical protein [Gammaproteobacteria bacterium]